MKQYFILDSRASYDIDEAEVFESFDESSDKKAIKHQKQSYPQQSTVLVGKDFKIIHIDI